MFQSDKTAQADWTSNPQVDAQFGIVVTSTVDTLYGLDVKNGAILWQRALQNQVHGTGSTAWVQNSVVYITSDDAMNAFASQDGTPLWRAPWAQVS
jgi:outer membrane protein assembly factor BamB